MNTLSAWNRGYRGYTEPADACLEGRASGRGGATPQGGAMKHAAGALLTAALIAASGCASSPPTSKERAGVWLAEAPRTLALHVDHALPQPGLRSRDYKVGERVGKGAGTGLGYAAMGVLEMCVMVPVIGCAIGAIMSPVTFTAGAVVGAAAVKSVDSYHSIDEAGGAPELLKRGNKAIDVPAMLEQDVLATAKALPRHVLYPAHGDGGDGARPKPDGELRLWFSIFELFGNAGDDPSVALVLRARADMRTPDDGSLWLGDFDYQSSSRRVSDWAADDAQLFRKDVDKGVSQIAAQIVEALGARPSKATIDKVVAFRSRTASSAEVAPPAAVALATPRASTNRPVEPGNAGLPVAGASWRYEYRDIAFGRRANVTVKVAEVSGRLIDELLTVTSDMSATRSLQHDIEADSTRFERYRINADYALIEFAPYLCAAGGESALRKVVSADGYSAGDGVIWSTRVDPPEWEQVTVRAGTFRALRLKIHGRRATHASYAPTTIYSFTVSVWYAPEIKRYVKLEHQTRHLWRPADDEVVELVEYRPHP
jgi:hypothetical protein